MLDVMASRKLKINNAEIHSTANGSTGFFFLCTNGLPTHTVTDCLELWTYASMPGHGTRLLMKKLISRGAGSNRAQARYETIVPSVKTPSD